MNKLDKLHENWLDSIQFKAQFEKVKVEEYPNDTTNVKPKVSVVLITYQHKDFIAKAIESIIMQETDFPFELIIGDDESTDGTREICIDFAKRYPNLIKLFLHKRENNISVMGVKSGIFQIAFNILQSRGELLVVTSGDDFWTDKLKLQKQVNYLSSNPQVSCCFHSWSKNRNGTIDNHLYTDIMPLTAMMRNYFQKLPKQFVEIINEDVFLYSICDLEGQRMFVDDVSPSIYNQHGNNLWKTQVQNNKNLALLALLNCKLYEVIKPVKFHNRFKHIFIRLCAKYHNLDPKGAEKDFVIYIKAEGLYWYFILWKYVWKFIEGFKIKKLLNKIR